MGCLSEANGELKFQFVVSLSIHRPSKKAFQCMKSKTSELMRSTKKLAGVGIAPSLPFLHIFSQFLHFSSHVYFSSHIRRKFYRKNRFPPSKCLDVCGAAMQGLL